MVKKWSTSVTHLVTSHGLVVSPKVLAACLRGVPIVKPAWALAIASLSPPLRRASDPPPPVEDFAPANEIDVSFFFRFLSSYEVL